LNHGSPAKRNAPGVAPMRLLWAEAGINLPTTQPDLSRMPVAGLNLLTNDEV
jgi:hypothetical protein